MNAIKENTVVFPKMKADQSGVVKGKYSNLNPDNYNIGNQSFGTGSNGSLFSGNYTNGGTSSSSSSSSKGFDWNSLSGMFQSLVGGASSLWGNYNQTKYGTDSYNQARIAESEAYAAANSKQKNTGLWIALVVVALLMIVGFALLISKKK